MPRKKFTLDQDTKTRLIVVWSYGWKEVIVQRDGHTIGKLDSRELLEEGRSFVIPEGDLHVQLVRQDERPVLRVLLNSQLLSPDANDPHLVIGKTSGTLFLIGGTIAGLSIMAALFQIDTLLGQGFSLVSSLFGLLFILLGLLVKHNSRNALLTAVALVAIDGVRLLFQSIDSGHVPVGSIILRLLLIFWLSRGFSAIRDVKETATKSNKLND